MDACTWNGKHVCRNILLLGRVCLHVRLLDDIGDARLHVLDIFASCGLVGISLGRPQVDEIGSWCIQKCHKAVPAAFP